MIVDEDVTPVIMPVDKFKPNVFCFFVYMQVQIQFGGCVWVNECVIVFTPLCICLSWGRTCLCMWVWDRERELCAVMTTSIIWHNQDESVSAQLHKQIPVLTSPSPRLETLHKLPPACWFQPAGMRANRTREHCHLKARGGHCSW